MWMMIVGLAITTYGAYMWFRDVIIEAHEKGDHTPIVQIGMRYGNPSIENAIKKLKENGTNKLFLVSMFPQYAQATSGSTFDEVYRVLKELNFNPKIVKIEHYYNEEFYLKSLAKSITDSDEYKNSEYLLFSFHGLPVRHLKKSDLSQSHCQKVENCCEQISENNEFCYKSHCVCQTCVLNNKGQDTEH